MEKAPSTGIGSRSFWGWMFVVGLLAYFLYAVQGILMPFIVGGFIAYALNPLTSKIARLPFISRSVASALSTVFFIVVVILFFTFIIPTLQKEISRLIVKSPEYSILIRGYWETILLKLSEHLTEHDIQILRDTIGGYAGNLVRMIGTTLGNILSNSLAIINLIAVTIVTPIIVFYLLNDWSTIIQRLHDFVPPRARPEMLSLFEKIDQTLAAFARGQTLVCLALSFYYTAVLVFLGVESAIAVGFFTGLLSFIPYIGAVVGYLVAMFLTLSQFNGDMHPVLLLSLFFAIGQVLEGKFLSPNLIGNRIGLNPVWIIFSLFAGSAIAGLLGVFIAIPVAGVLGVLVKHAFSKYTQTPFYLELPSKRPKPKPSKPLK